MTWISVKEALPEEYKKVLVYNEQNGCSTAYFFSELNTCGTFSWMCEGSYEYDDHFTHWMELPEGPKDDDVG